MKTAKISLTLLFVFFACVSYGANVVMLCYNVDGAVERGFRDGIIYELPDTRFYTFGAGGDLSLFRRQVEVAKTIPADIYYTNGQTGTKELLADRSIPPLVFVSIQYPFQDELYKDTDFSGSAGVKTNIPIRRLLLALKNIVDYKKLGVLRTDDHRNYDFSIAEIKKMQKELGFTVAELDSTDLFALNRQLAKTRPDAIYIPAHGKVDVHMFDIIKAHNIPTIAEDTDDVRHRGAMLALVVDGYRAGRMAAQKAVHMLKTGELPNQPITSIEHFMFVVNLLTAARLGVQIPMQYLIIADQIIR